MKLAMATTGRSVRVQAMHMVCQDCGYAIRPGESHVKCRQCGSRNLRLEPDGDKTVVLRRSN